MLTKERRFLLEPQRFLDNLPKIVILETELGLEQEKVRKREQRLLQKLSIKERLPRIIENIWEHKLNKSENKELICYHDECYATFTSWAPAFDIEVPFKPIYFYDYLYNRIKASIENITPINAKVAYQRPCSNRLNPEQQHWVDDIFEMIGVERVKRKYDREDALCCGGILRMQGRDDLAHDLQIRNLDDMVAAGAEYCVFNCPFCFYTLSEMVRERNIKPIMMIDLCILSWNNSTRKRS